MNSLILTLLSFSYTDLLSCSLLERFAIFSREQEHTQKETGNKSGENTLDLVSYVEYQRNHRLILKVHKEALFAMRQFWERLLQSRVSFVSLSQCIKKIDDSVKQAERVYRQVLIRHPHSVKILRLYARFLLDAKNDPWAAAKWLTQAEKIELEDETNKETGAFGDNAMVAQYGGKLLDDMGEESQHGMRVEETRAVIIMNSNCIIQMANKAVYSLFGYNKKNE